jgi:hypothetical protein
MCESRIQIGPRYLRWSIWWEEQVSKLLFLPSVTITGSLSIQNLPSPLNFHRKISLENHFDFVFEVVL